MHLVLVFLACCVIQRDLHSFPTRRSSDLGPRPAQDLGHEDVGEAAVEGQVRPDYLREGRLRGGGTPDDIGAAGGVDRKSTRLNSSHLVNSYAVFCLNKKRRLQKYRTQAG